MESVKNLLNADARHIDELKAKMGAERHIVDLISRNIDGMRDPQKARMASAGAQDVTTEYFQRLISTFEERVRQYSGFIEEIERNLEYLDTAEQFDPRGGDRLLRSATSPWTEQFFRLAQPSAIS